MADDPTPAVAKKAAKKTTKRAAAKKTSSGSSKVTVQMVSRSGPYRAGQRRSFDKATADELVRNGHARPV